MPNARLSLVTVGREDQRRTQQDLNKTPPEVDLLMQVLLISLTNVVTYCSMFFGNCNCKYNLITCVVAIPLCCIRYLLHLHRTHCAATNQAGGNECGRPFAGWRQSATRPKFGPSFLILLFFPFLVVGKTEKCESQDLRIW